MFRVIEQCSISNNKTVQEEKKMKELKIQQAQLKENISFLIEYTGLTLYSLNTLQITLM